MFGMQGFCFLARILGALAELSFVSILAPTGWFCMKFHIGDL
jgi:hypothetical protein